LAEARQLADEAAEAAAAAAEDADRKAKQLAAEAEQQTKEAEARAKATEQLRERSAAIAKETARELSRATPNGGLKSYNKPELIDLAASIGIKGRTTMTKDELVDAIMRSTRQAVKGTR
jgi:cell pole-organizing protein PopZ